MNPHDSPKNGIDLTRALQDRENRIERQLNYIRFGSIIFLSLFDIFTLIYMDFSIDAAHWFFLISMAGAFLLYFIFINYFTRHALYHWWLKYVISTIDFGILFSVISFLKKTGIQEQINWNIDISFFVILFSMILIFLCSLRYGKSIIVYNTIIALAVISWFISQVTDSFPVLLYADAFIIISGFLTMVISSSMTRLYLNARKRERLTRFLSRELVELIDAGEINLKLGGIERLVTVLMADIRGFTRLSEKRNPEEIVSMLNTYFTEMTDVILAKGGVIDKFIGDAVMAVFGLPEEKEDDAFRAVQSAVLMQERLKKVNELLDKTGFPSLQVGVALHTGIVVAGNIGSENRMDYTVIGDNVNITSRIEAMNKEYRTSILFSESTNEAVSEQIKTIFVDDVVLRGRSLSTKLYTVQ